MKVELKPFQEEAVSSLIKTIQQMQDSYERYGQLSAVSLTAPTGSGKTVMASAVIEALFFANAEESVPADEKACILWLSDSPSLNDQTRARFTEASDKLADWVTDERHLETVTNNFGASHEMFDARHVYFMSKDLLGRGKLLEKGGEANSGRVFWDILDRTINDPGRNLYLFIDEAHRGLGANASSDNPETIYAHLIDGFEGRSPMPVVIGISATPKRFEGAMQQRANRVLMPAVSVTPKQVQESGLLKDTIVLRVPEKDDSVEHQYLDMACDRLRISEKLWERYCKEQGIDVVRPLMVVQVRDKIGNDGLKDLCDQICERIPELDKRTAFANVFGEHAALLPAAQYPIPYIAPEQVEFTRSVRVLFAKEAISNGWDCPRAEVIFSQRRRSDDTYIAQLVGRMVRTPLARRIDSDESLNSVACYLPQFNPEATQSVIDYLTGKTDDVGGAYVDTVITNPENVTWGGIVFQEEERLAQALAPQKNSDEPTFDDLLGAGFDSFGDDAWQVSTLTAPGEPAVAEVQPNEAKEAEETGEAKPQQAEAAPAPVMQQQENKPAIVNPFTKEDWEGIEAAFKSLRKRVIPKKARNEFASLNKTTTLMMNTGLDTHAGEDARRGFCNQLDGAIVANPEEYAEQKHNVEVAEMQIITIDKLNDNEVTRESEAPETDAVGIEDAAKLALQKFGGEEFVNAYKKHLYQDKKLDFREINLTLASAARCSTIVETLEAWAEKTRSAYFDAHATERDFLPEADRQEYDRLVQETSGIRDSSVDFPRNVTTSGDFERFPKHVVFSKQDGLCPLDLRPFEKYVLRQELAKERTVAFYRNPSNNSPQVFSIPYTMPNGRLALRPDFIFFVRDIDGNIRPSIVDPHGDFLGDSLPKLKGYVNYLQDYADTLVQVLSVTTLSGTDEVRFLNLLKKDVQEAILAFDGDHVDELYRGPLAEHYGNWDGK